MPEPGRLRCAVIEITNRCNLRCPHCASTSGRARENELTPAEIQTLLHDIAELGGEEITLIGGEIFLRDDWFEICKTVGGLGMKLILISNGILIRGDEMLARLDELKPWVIGISVDGASRESYRRLRGVDGFDHCVSLLHRLVADGHEHVNAITTVMRSNVRQFDDFVRLFDNTGITWQVQIANIGGERFDRKLFITRDEFAWLVARMRDVFVDRSDTFQLRHMDDFGYFPLDPKLRFLHETWSGCIGGIELIGVRSNGDVLGCLSLGDDFVEANLRRERLEDIWRSDRYFQRFRRKEDLLTGQCARCPYALQCRAGCTSIAYSATGAVGCNPYCIRALETEQIVKGI